jgi:hypothetical protein
MSHLPLSFLLGLLATPSPSDVVLKHDDGTPEDKRSTAGAGHAVLFERPGEAFAVTAVRIHGSRYGGDYDPFWAVARVTICDEGLRPLARSFLPYDAWSAGSPGWAEVAIGPVLVPARFCALVEFFPTATKGIYLSIDRSASGHSLSATESQPGKALEGGEWMIRVAGTDKELRIEQPDPGETAVLARGEGEPLDKASTAGSGHAVLFQAPAKQRLLTRVSLCGQRYGGDYDPGETFFHLFVCDKKLRPLARSAHEYALFPTDELTWIELEIPPIEVPREFALLVHFDPSRTQGVYLGEWKEEKAASLHGLPEKVGERTEKGEGWMIRATLAASKGKQPLPAAAATAEEGGPDALAVAELIGRIDTAEAEEDVERANALADELARIAPAEAERLGRFTASEHALARHAGAPAEAVRSILGVLEAAHAALTSRFGFERASAVPGKRVHVHVVIAAGEETKLFTSPASERYSLIVLRGERSALSAPTRGGPHAVYGLCHELGHVLMGWQAPEHEWAHYLGSVLASDVHAALGDEGWFEPYDFDAIEGLPRFLRDIEGARPGLEDATSRGKLFHEIGERFGQGVYARAFAWIREHREGERFQAVRLYALTDLRDALLALGEDEAAVAELFGR